MTAPTTFKCGHPRSPENSAPFGRKGYVRCRFCERVRQMNIRAERPKKPRRLTLGQQISLGIIK